MSEIWKPIPSLPYHEASNLGRIRSCPRKLTRKNGSAYTVRGQVLQQQQDGNGYWRVPIKDRRIKVHRLVAEAFYGPSDQQVRHLNGNPADSRLENLAYGTNSQNQMDSVRHGTHYMASRTHCKNGHEFTPDNTKLRSDGQGRQCITCEQEKCRRYRTGHQVTTDPNT